MSRTTSEPVPVTLDAAAVSDSFDVFFAFSVSSTRIEIVQNAPGVSTGSCRRSAQIGGEGVKSGPLVLKATPPRHRSHRHK